MAAVGNDTCEIGVAGRSLPAWSSPAMGLLLVGHGTAGAAGIEEFHRLVDRVTCRCGGLPIEACFLEKAEPTIAQGVARLAERGTRVVVVVPALLFAAGHARRDIPIAVTRALAGHAGMTARMAMPLGCHWRIVSLLAERYGEAVAGRVPVAPDQTALLLVGRGSSDREATSQFRQLTYLHGQSLAPIRVQGCFLAVAEPSLATALAGVARGGCRRVVVQPHLLLRGRLLADLACQAEALIGPEPECECLIAGHLGPASAVVEAILDRVASVAAVGGYQNVGSTGGGSLGEA